MATILLNGVLTNASTLTGTDLADKLTVSGGVDGIEANLLGADDLIEVEAEPVATLDLGTCTSDAAGSGEMCVEWTDPDWTAGEEAIYYVRVLEQPTCRWSWRDCLSVPESERPGVCSDPTVSPSVQERAWTSPIRVRSAG